MPTACGRRWFVVLPDREPASAVAASLVPYACRTLTHASGRPWLVGCWPADQEATTRAGAMRLAALGPSDLTSDVLAACGTAVDGAAGSYHLLASDDGEVYARGTATGTRRLFTAVVGQVTVAADRASTLAWLTGAEIDRSRLALRTLLPAFPFPYETVSMWRGVIPVPPQQALRLGSDGGVRSERWWHPPASDLPLDEAAPLLRAALCAAIASRVRPGQVWGADLSGGMDSTSVCFLAHQAGADLVAVTLQWSAPTNEDAGYARIAAGHLPRLTHLVYPSAQLPLPFSGTSDRRPAGEEPTPVLRYRATQERLAKVLAGHGARRRLSGHGGDHMVTPPAAYVHPLLRRSPRTGVAHAMAHRALRRWPLPATARALLSDLSLPRWLQHQAAALETVRRDRAPDFGWGRPPALPPWATGLARELAASSLREEAADRTEPLGPDRGTHAWIHEARLAGIDAAHFADAGMHARLPVEA
ncbi:asparagine synthase-related protein [Streptomyces sp. NPDC052020]|uniref:asparagine synthase-related protein n=1 Tax=Streptomyces sp. NPDC052020 TaxID=3155677 RepID=UPI003433B5C2